MPDIQSIDENKLLTQLLNGDVAAFEVIYWKYQHAVYLNAQKLVKDAEIAQDIVQEVFTSLWEKRKSIDVNRSVGGWLFVACYNRSVNELKKKLRESKTVKAFHENEVEADSRSNDFEIHLQILEKAIHNLSPQKRKVYELCKLKGLTYEEAALEMHISKHTVKEYLSEAGQSVKDFARNHPESGSVALFIFFI